MRKTPFYPIKVDKTTDVSIIKQLYYYSHEINIRDQGNIQLFVFIVEVQIVSVLTPRAVGAAAGSSRL